jgi:hypothetical protein
MSGTPAGSVCTDVHSPPEKLSIVADGRLGGPRNSMVTRLPALTLMVAPCWSVTEIR